jgi:hypothetical protein
MLFDGSLMFEGSIYVDSKFLVGRLRPSSEGVDVALRGLYFTETPLEGSLFDRFSVSGDPV